MRYKGSSLKDKIIADFFCRDTGDSLLRICEYRDRSRQLPRLTYSEHGVVGSIKQSKEMPICNG